MRPGSFPALPTHIFTGKKGPGYQANSKLHACGGCACGCDHIGLCGCDCVYGGCCE